MPDARSDPRDDAATGAGDTPGDAGSDPDAGDAVALDAGVEAGDTESDARDGIGTDAPPRPDDTVIVPVGGGYLTAYPTCEAADLARPGLTPLVVPGVYGGTDSATAWTSRPGPMVPLEEDRCSTTTPIDVLNFALATDAVAIVSTRAHLGAWYPTPGAASLRARCEDGTDRVLCAATSAIATARLHPGTYSIAVDPGNRSDCQLRGRDVNLILEPEPPPATNVSCDTARLLRAHEVYRERMLGEPITTGTPLRTGARTIRRYFAFDHVAGSASVSLRPGSGGELSMDGSLRVGRSCAEAVADPWPATVSTYDAYTAGSGVTGCMCTPGRLWFVVSVVEGGSYTLEVHDE